MATTSMPARYERSVIPHIMVENAAAAIDFYRRAFDATEIFRLAMPDGRIVHAEITIGDSLIMLGDADPPFRSPVSQDGPTVGLHVYVEDADALLDRAVQAGATVIQPVQDMFYGDRMGMLRDPFGHVWVLLEHVEDLLPEEIERRFQQEMRTART